MPDWISYLREHLDLPEMKGHKEERMLLELADHAEDLYLEALAEGATEEEAASMVKGSFGDASQATAELTRAEPAHGRAQIGRLLERREETLRHRGGLAQNLGDLMRSLRLSLRTLIRRPVFSGVIILVLSLGIGSSTAIFTLLDAVILSPLPFEGADRLVTIGHSAPGVGIANAGQCAAWHFTYEQENRVFEDVGLYDATSLDVIGLGAPEAVPALGVTSGVFRALRLRPTLGRSFTPRDEDPDAPATVLLSHAYWQSRFGADPETVGQLLKIGGETAEIIGVMPPSLGTLWPDQVIFFPLRYRQSTLFVGNTGFGALARLKEDVTMEEATTDLARMLPLAFEKFPDGPADEAMKEAGFVPILSSLKEDLVGSVTSLLWILMSGVAVLLLIACANVANLFLVRAEGKETEMAVRGAIGASPAFLSWEFLKESLILGVLGGLGGLLLAATGLKLLIALAGASLPRLVEVSLNPTVLAFTLAISLGSGFFFGTIPVLRTRRRGWVGALKAGSCGGVSGNRRHRAQNALVISQLALASLLLVAAFLMVRSLQSLTDVDPGFGDVEDVLTLKLNIPTLEIADLAEVAQTHETIARRLAEIPGVTSVGLATDIPMDGDYNSNTLYLEGGTEQALSRRHKWIGEGYLETLQIPLLAGRAFTWDDIHARIPAVLVSAKLADEYWGSAAAALGKRVAIRASPVHWHEVIGVVANVRDDGLDQEEVAEVYWPQVTMAFWNGTTADEAFAWRSMSYVVRSSRMGSPGFLGEVQNAIWSVNGNLPLRAVSPLSSLMTRSMERRSFSLVLLAVAAGVALLLGLIGAYAVLSYTVSQRTRELALRMALGARATDIKGMVLRRALSLTAIGVTIGLGLALGLTRLMTGLLYGVSPADPLTFLVVAVGLTTVAVAACYLPARRAADVDLMAALRSE